MSEHDIPIVDPTIDYTQVPPIHQKRTITFINQFIIHTVTFLNKFALSCEEKLFEFENKLQRVEASLEILESQLSSIPGLQNESQSSMHLSNPTNLDEKIEQETEATKQIVSNNVDETDKNEPIEPPLEEKSEDIKMQPVCEDPLYKKYFKFISIGVPKPAVKLKMQQDGLDPSLLDTPKLLVPVKSGATDD
ncbi:WASH complex subunit 3 [Orussus abietinus]|uniref:WASH complex subunit 3 n=1 Tax=Orussus abietinus TaxID=222816 RepID=UPI00062699F1|nr:WASH complex subunit 3 [Orussus abietinus]